MNRTLSETFTPILSGQHNFRDLGGIPAMDGRTIRPGLLFRSGDLHSITDDDVTILEQAGIRMIIDFRSERERLKRPNREIPGLKEVRYLPIFDAPRDLASKYVAESDSSNLERLLVDEYARIVSLYRKEYAEFLWLVANSSEIPLVFQCSAGKDRTGLATIFLLTALGVGYEHILNDYFLTNLHAQAHAHEIIGLLNNNGYNGHLMQPMLEVRQEYLDAALDVISKTSENLENFVTSELKADREKLRERYLK
ncbi:MAG: tyrosine-protein phosphatase [Bacteroidetes bacterium]|nr:tyrosine-protein phosphatase [Bacteroidota bacterium]